MKDFFEAVESGFVEKDGYHSFRFGDKNEYELAIEPLLFGRFAVALYRHYPGHPYPTLILEDKIPVRPTT